MISIIKSSVKVSCGRQKFSRDPRRGASWERGLRRIIVWLQHEDSGGHEHEAEWAWSAWSIHMYVKDRREPPACRGTLGVPAGPLHTYVCSTRSTPTRLRVRALQSLHAVARR